MATQTITAMFHNRADAEKAVSALRSVTGLAHSSVKMLPEHDVSTTTSASKDDGGFMSMLRNFFMPEEDRYGYAEGLRRGSIMVAVDTDETHRERVMDVLEESGAIDLDTEEARWRTEGWRGYEPSAAGASTASGFRAMEANTPGTGGTAGTTAAMDNIGSSTLGTAGTTGSAGVGNATGTAGAGVTGAGMTGARTTGAGTTGTGMAGTTGTGSTSPMRAGTEERIPLAEETLRVGKRQVIEGRVRIRSYVVETPVSETVHLREEHVNVERRAVDRPVAAGEDAFRERSFEATESREEAVVSKEAHIREEVVVNTQATEHDETVKDTVRRTEIREDRGDAKNVGASGEVRDPAGTNRPL